MGPDLRPGTRRSSAWALAKRQHGVISRDQLLELGFSIDAIRHRIRVGRLHELFRGVYAVGARDPSRLGLWLAAVLSCGPGVALSHRSAAELWEIMPRDRRASTLNPRPSRPIHVSTRLRSGRRRPDLQLHRRPSLRVSELTERLAIPVTAPATTLVDLAAGCSRSTLEAAINEADKRDLIDPERLGDEIARMPRRPGLTAVKELLGVDFRLTENDLERRFLRTARRAGLDPPRTQAIVNGFEVDFFWPDLGLVVETDGLTYHRTSLQQVRDRERDQAHTAAGLTCLRFTRAQVRFEPQHVEEVLAATVARLP